MKTKPKVQTQQDVEIRTGSILIAKPFWMDERYKRSVILLLTHDDEGSTGIIINKMSNLSLNEALPEIEHNGYLFYGGPSNARTISFIHSNPSIPDAIYLGNDFFWGGNYYFLRNMFEARQLNPDDFRFCAGFVKWKYAQLANEINENLWWVSEMTYNELILTSADQLWEEKLMEDGHIYGIIHPFPDPLSN